MTLATTVRAVGGPRAGRGVAKSLGALDRLSGGRVCGALRAGLVGRATTRPPGLEFAERWPRSDESIAAIRALWRPDGGAEFRGRLLRDGGDRPASPDRRRPGGPPIWVGAAARACFAGGPAGQRVAGVGLQHDPRALRRGLAVTPGEAGGPGEGPRLVPERRGDDVVLRHRRPPGGRADPPGAGHPDRAPPEAMLRERLPIGPARVRREAHRVRPCRDTARPDLAVADERRQLERFWDEVRPLVAP